MAEATKQSQEDGEALNRGRIQAQGGGTEQSEPWAQKRPPTESEMLRKCDLLERKLTDRERKDREVPFTQLRRFIQAAARSGGVVAPLSKSFLKRGSKDVRVDIEVRRGAACVPDPRDAQQDSGGASDA
jgi:hypothetical protein